MLPDRRSFLSGLASLPLIGGGVALIGQPTAAATPVTEELVHSYKAWLFMEHRMLSWELVGYQRRDADDMECCFRARNPGYRWHSQWDRPGVHGLKGWIDAPQASARAAIVLAAVGCDL